MAHETRTSEQGTVFDAATVRDFLLKALGHDAVIDQVNELLFEYVMESKYHPLMIAENLKPMIDEILGVATFEDWNWVARALIAEACEALGVEHPLDRTPGTGDQRSASKDTDALKVDVNSPHTFVKNVSRDDALVLREKIEVSKIADTRRRVPRSSSHPMSESRPPSSRSCTRWTFWRYGKSSPSSMSAALRP
jgi:hypothetical protein